MKYIKYFENKSTENFIEGDLVKFIPPSKYDDDIFYVYSTHSSNYENQSLLYFYNDYKKFINDELDDINGIGWIDNDKLKKISEKEADIILNTKKYNL